MQEPQMLLHMRPKMYYCIFLYTKKLPHQLQLPVEIFSIVTIRRIQEKGIGNIKKTRIEVLEGRDNGFTGLRSR